MIKCFKFYAQNNVNIKQVCLTRYCQIKESKGSDRRIRNFFKHPLSEKGIKISQVDLNANRSIFVSNHENNVMKSSFKKICLRLII